MTLEEPLEDPQRNMVQLQMNLEDLLRTLGGLLENRWRTLGKPLETLYIIVCDFGKPLEDLWRLLGVTTYSYI